MKTARQHHNPTARKAWLKTAAGRAYTKRSIATAATRMRTAFKIFIRAIKSQPCQDCGGIFLPCAMDFDHVRGEKLFDLCRGYNKGLSKCRAEIAKCDLVCANCHRVRTTMRRYGVV